VAPGWAMVNQRLAEHYGIDGVVGVDLRPVALPEGSPFGGIWTQPAILKVTADGSSTSPVKRGLWVAKQLLGTTVSPPPPNIEPIDPDTRGATTVRQQLELHSNDPSCASCHKKFDPFGLALESFDVMGQRRSHYRVLNPQAKKSGKKGVRWQDGLPVDPSGVMPNGEEFSDIAQLRKILSKRPERLAWGVTTHMVTYATGSPVTPLDRHALRNIVQGAAGDDYGLRSLVHGVVQSELFRWK